MPGHPLMMIEVDYEIVRRLRTVGVEMFAGNAANSALLAAAGTARE